MRDSFETLLYQHQVDVIFGAHHHSYQRTCPIYQGKCGTGSGYQGPVIVNIGMAGAGNSKNVPKVPPSQFKVVDITHHGFTTIKANSSAFVLQYIRGDDRQVHDNIILSK